MQYQKLCQNLRTGVSQRPAGLAQLCCCNSSCNIAESKTLHHTDPLKPFCNVALQTSTQHSLQCRTTDLNTTQQPNLRSANLMTCIKAFAVSWTLGYCMSGELCETIVYMSSCPLCVGQQWPSRLVLIIPWTTLSCIPAGICNVPFPECGHSEWCTVQCELMLTQHM